MAFFGFSSAATSCSTRSHSPTTCAVPIQGKTFVLKPFSSHFPFRILSILRWFSRCFYCYTVPVAFLIHASVMICWICSAGVSKSVNRTAVKWKRVECRMNHRQMGRVGRATSRRSSSESRKSSSCRGRRRWWRSARTAHARWALQEKILEKI